ncbi:MAG: metal ABC transporter permease [Patescibacteria group bacterium]
MLEIFNYSFIIRAFEAGIIVAIIAPLIGIFLVLRRYALIADTLSHVSLAGVALGLLLKLPPLLTAIVTSVLASFFIEKLRLSRKISGESSLAIFLSGSLAIAIILINIANGFTSDIFNYLFGSIATVKQTDVFLIGGLGIGVIVTVIAFYKELLYSSFDEEAARVSGLPTERINLLLIMLTALTVSLAIPIVGVLLIAALIVIPIVSALQLKKSFIQTILYAEAFSIFSVIAGIIASFYLNLSPGGTIVLLALAIFISILLITRKKK